MNSKQMYRYIVDNSFHLNNCRYDSSANKFSANVFIGNDRSKVAEILNNNDFFSVYTTDKIDIENQPKFTINFMFNDKEWDSYSINIADIIDTRVALGGNRIVISCESYVLMESHKEPEEVEETAIVPDAPTTMKPALPRANRFFNLFCDGFLDHNFAFPKFDFDEMVKNAKSNGGKCYIRQTINDNGKISEKIYDNGKVISNEYTAEKKTETIGDAQTGEQQKPALKDMVNK